MDAAPANAVCFGPFKLDLRAGELRQDGRTVRFQEQPFQVLKMLVDHPGEVVTREEIRRKLWPNDTIVEFDHSINAAIKKLRLALGDSAEEPQYVETVARRGYRLMVPVEWVGEQPSEEPGVTVEAGAESPAPAKGSLTGKKISHYRVLEMLGGGGMGVVYKAEDIKLGRQVALKFLPEELASSPEALERFQREARAASALNHPNICTVYEVDEFEGQPFIAMELMKGMPLSQHVAGRPLPISNLLDLSAQIAGALDAAHREGIVHRDIKPANIFVTEGGLAKVLDFGLAKRPSAIKKIADMAGAPAGATATSDDLLTRPGVALGTVAYMSPEQARGEELDARTDLFSFGAVVYEMATGKQAFSGNSSAAIFHAILGQAPASPLSFNPQLPSELERIITKALEKDREVRYQVASEMRADLKRLKRDTDSGRAASAAVSGEVAERVHRLRWIWLAVLAGAAVLAAVVLTLLLRAPPLPLKVLSIVPLTSDGRSKPGENLATDGFRLYFTELVDGRSSLAAVSLKGGGVVLIPTPFKDISLIDGSPDGSELLVVDGTVGQDSPIWVVPVVAGSPRRLGDAVGHAGSWSPDGRKIVWVNGPDLYVSNSDGTGSRKLVSMKPEGMVWRPAWSPDGRRLVFTRWGSGLWEASADGAGLRPLLPGWNEECCGIWTPNGKYFIFASGRGSTSFNLWAIREDAGLFRKAHREPVQLTAGPVSLRFGSVVSRDGKKIFTHGQDPRGELARYDARSQQFVPYLGRLSVEGATFSKDGQWVAYTTYPQRDLWRSKVDGSQELQLTYPPLIAYTPRWSPDGKRIVFSGQTPPNVGWHIYVVPADGGSSPQQLAPAGVDSADPTWSPDGNSLMFGRASGSTSRNFAIHILDLRTQQVSTVPGSEGLNTPNWSPDGRYIAAQPVPDKPDPYTWVTPRLVLFDFATQKWVDLAKMNDIGSLNWSRNGKYLYFGDYGSEPAIFRMRIGDRKLERVVTLRETPQAGEFEVGFSLAPDDSPLILHDTDVQEIYAVDWEAP